MITSSCVFNAQVIKCPKKNKDMEETINTIKQELEKQGKKIEWLYSIILILLAIILLESVFIWKNTEKLKYIEREPIKYNVITGETTYYD